MKNSAEENRLLLQSDWFEALRTTSTTEKIWSGYRLAGQKSEFIDVKQEKGVLTPLNDDRLSIERLTGRKMRLSTALVGASTTFVAPFAQYDVLHRTSVEAIDISNGGLGVSASTDGSLLVWSSETGTVQRKLKGHALDVYKCRFFPSGLVVLSGGCDMQLKIWSVETGECARSLTGHTQAIMDVNFVGAGKNILSCSKDGTAKLWDCGSAACLATISPESGCINAMSLGESQNAGGNQEAEVDAGESGTEGKMLALTTELGHSFVYDLRSKDLIASFKLDSAGNAVATASDHDLFCGTQNGTIHRCDLRAKAIVEERRSNRSFVSHLVHSPKLGLVASYGDGTVIILDNYLNSAPPKFEFSGPDCDPVHDFALNNKFIVTACRDKIIRKYMLSDCVD
uniref:Proteasomal ATPase-associated factor 1 n=1 Tax=Plectus sambesii TaxID=2011161 RepID=A0A914V8R6_9BILA